MLGVLLMITAKFVTCPCCCQSLYLFFFQSVVLLIVMFDYYKTFVQAPGGQLDELLASLTARYCVCILMVSFVTNKYNDDDDAAFVLHSSPKAISPEWC